MKNPTQLTDKILEKHNFTNRGKCNFRFFEKMNYWVKNGVCLFYNAPVSDFQEAYLIGYTTMIQGEYVATKFRWIRTEQELIDVYESVTGKKITATNY